jgi:hypothetical protein
VRNNGTKSHAKCLAGSSESQDVFADTHDERAISLQQAAMQQCKPATRR